VVEVEVDPAGGLTAKLLPTTTTTSAASEAGRGDPTSSVLAEPAPPELVPPELVPPEPAVPDVELPERPVSVWSSPGS
jgi:hypothetical protein